MKTPREVEQEYLKRGLSKNFCPVPFTTLIINPNGTVNVCRQKGTDFIVGDLRKQSIHEIWNSEKLQKWRAEFLQGNPQTCSQEIKHMGCHLSPGNIDYLEHADIKQVVDGPILKLGANLNGECNLRCKMCNIWKMPSGLYNELDFWQWAPTTLLPYVKEIDLYSGEPFIQEDTFKLIDVMAEVNPGCKWTITTNLNWEFNNKIRNALDKITIKNIIASLDSIDPNTYCEIRRGGNYQLAINTLSQLAEYSKKCKSAFDVVINFLIQRDNWSELEDQIVFTEKLGVRSFRSYVYIPEEYSLSSLNENEKLAIIREMTRRFKVSTLKKSMKVLRPMMDSLSVKNRKKVMLELAAVEDH